MKSLPSNLHGQHGVALIASLIIMLMMTIIALSAMRGSGTFEKMAGNTREKQRSLQVAQDSLVYGEWWLSQTTNATAVANPVACSTTVTFATMQVCNSPLSGVPATTLAMYSKFKPSTSMTVAAGGGTATSGDINYASNPGIYIAVMPGKYSGQSVPLYQVTAIGYGGVSGANGTVSIVQSLYELGGSVACSGNCTGGGGGGGTTGGGGASAGGSL
jgi:type IV pilus assembly protein PilX